MRLPLLLRELAIAKGEVQYSKLLTNLAKVDVLIPDDWGLTPLSTRSMMDWTLKLVRCNWLRRGLNQITTIGVAEARLAKTHVKKSDAPPQLPPNDIGIMPIQFCRLDQGH